MGIETSFIVPAFFILIAPGPTNALLASAGGALGLRKAPPFLCAQILGYALAITVARQALGLFPASQTIAIVLRFAVAAYLLLLAARLWRVDRRLPQDQRRVTPVDLFVTTALNPKALIFACAILPFDHGDAFQIFATFAALTAISGAFWFFLGERVAQAAPSLFFRGCSAAIGVFAAIVCVSPFL